MTQEIKPTSLKSCATCKEEKPFADFYKNRTKDNYFCDCKN